MALRILVADDHGVLRAGLRALLDEEPGFHVVGEADCGDGVLEQTRALLPDLVLLDLNMPGGDGIHITHQLREHFPEVRVLVLTVYEDEGLLREAIKAGAAGYIVKRAVESELISAIRAVARGELYVHPALTRALLDERVIGARPAPELPEQLTPRETDVLRRIVLGYTNRQAAEELGLSVRTVESHRAHLMAKLGLKTRVELVRWAAEQGIIS